MPTVPSRRPVNWLPRSNDPRWDGSPNGAIGFHDSAGNRRFPLATTTTCLADDEVGGWRRPGPTGRHLAAEFPRAELIRKVSDQQSGAITPKYAEETWADGLKKRWTSGAMGRAIPPPPPAMAWLSLAYCFWHCLRRP